MLLCVSSSDVGVLSNCVGLWCCRHGTSPGVIGQNEVHDDSWAMPPPGPIDDLIAVPAIYTTIKY